MESGSNICYCPMLKSIFAHPNQVRSRISGAIPPLLHLPSWYIQRQICFYTVFILRRNLYPYVKRLRWSRGSVLAFGTQVREFASGRSRRVFRAKKILSTPSFGGEVKPLDPCRSFTACKRSLNVTWNSAFRQTLPEISLPQFHLPPLGALAW